LKERFEQLPGVSRVVEAASLVPLDQEHKLEMLAEIHFRLRKLPEPGVVIPHALPRIAEVRKTIARLQETLATNATEMPALEQTLQILDEKLAAADPEAGA